MEVLGKGNYIGHITRTLQLDGIIVGTTVYANEQTNGGMHSHENPHISFVLKGGNIDKRVSAEKEQLPGCISYYHAGEVHQTIQKIFPAQHINLELDSDFLSRYRLSEEKICKCISSTPDAKFFMIKIYYEFLVKDEYSMASIDMLLLELISNHLPKEKNTPHWVTQLKELLRNNWNNTIELSYLSRLLNVHPVTISKNFSKYFGCSLGEYMRKLKVEHSIPLIKSGNTSLTGIAYDCGFADQSHFIRTFKNFTGVLPLRFKKA